jgi:hypothetical protein
MMRKRLSIILLLFLIFLTFNHKGIKAQNPGFFIENADGSNYLSMTSSPGLISLISDVLPRFRIENANGNNFFEIQPAPAELENLVSQIAARFTLQSANGNSFFNFIYPRDLINDTSPPLISNISFDPTACRSMLVTWFSDEYTKGVITYGNQSGNYPYQASTELFEKWHSLPLPDLVPEQTYYFRIIDTDRSGNQTESQEFSFIAPYCLNLPFINR